MNSRRTFTRLPTAIVGVVVCLCGVWMSGREGLAQHLAGRALLTDSVADADRAVAFGAVPEAHYARAIVLDRTSVDAASEFQNAVALRPNDYALWIEFGSARDRRGDTDGAVAALTESTKLAPFYAQPRWHLGNALFRAGRIQEALIELRLASQSDPKLALPSLALIWSAVNGDVAEVEKAFAAHGRAMETALARFLVKRGKVTDAMRHFRAAGGISPEEQSAMVADLLAAKNFDAAYEVWSMGRGNGSSGVGQVRNGSFEDPIVLEAHGFGWQVVQDRQGIQVVIDPAARANGGQTLRIDWTGAADSTLPIASQLVIVEPGTKYRLDFAARGADLMMLGLPAVSVTDAADASAHASDYLKSALVQSPPLPKGTSDWQQYSAEFTTGASTRAVLIRIHRANCTIQPCPAFGHAWFDDFSLSK